MFKREMTLVSFSENQHVNIAHVMFCFEHASYILNITLQSTCKGIHTHTEKKESAGKVRCPGQPVGRALRSNLGHGAQKALRVYT